MQLELHLSAELQRYFHHAGGCDKISFIANGKLWALHRPTAKPWLPYSVPAKSGVTYEAPNLIAET
jgi:hypothetical protein